MNTTVTTPSIGEQIDRLYQMRAERLQAEKLVEGLKSEEATFKAAIIEQLKETGLESGTGKDATASIKYSTKPNVKDWEALYAYIKENDMFELLHKRITSTLWAAMQDDGFTVPGTESIVVVDLSLTKSKRG